MAIYEIPDDVKVFTKTGENTGTRYHEMNGELDQFKEKRDRPLPPVAFNSVREILRSYFGLASGVLLNSDIAYRRDRRYQRQMRRDPDVMSPLLQRQTAVALLEWDIVPDDETNKKDVERAKEIKAAIEKNLRRPHEFFRHMLEAVWYGPSAANIVYARDETGYIVPVFWKPFHPDSLSFTHVGQLGMRVGPRFEGKKVQGPDANVHLFTERERGAIVLHVAFPQAPDYEEPEEARQLFSGRGLRDIVFFPWKLKQVSLQLWATFIERYSMGQRIGTYPAGNTTAKEEMETIMRNAIGDTTILFPRSPDNPDVYSFDVKEPAMASAKVHADLIEGYLAGAIKEMIIGQTATTEATNEGLGTGISEQHAQTFGRIIRWDAKNLDDTLTYELVRPMADMNYGEGVGSSFRWKFSVPEVDALTFLSAVEKAVNLGVQIPTRLVRGRLGFDEPQDQEEVLVAPFSGDMGGFGGGALDFAAINGAKEAYKLSLRDGVGRGG